MSVRRKPNGKWEVRKVLGGRRVGRTFDYKRDADAYDTWLERRKQLGEAAPPEPDITLAKFVEDYWRLYAVPNLAKKTREAYKVVWGKHLQPRIGGRELRELKPKMLTRLRADLHAAGVNDPTILKAFTMLQSVLSFAVDEERIQHNPARDVRKPRQRRARKVVPIAPEVVEDLRAHLLTARPHVGVRDATIVSVIAYGGLRTFSELWPLEFSDIGEKTLRVHDSSKTHESRVVRLLRPLASDLAQWRLATGHSGRRRYVFSRADGSPWTETDWRNWRTRVWQPAAAAVGIGRLERETRYVTVDGVRRRRTKSRYEGANPYDLRHSFVSLLAAEGKSLKYVAEQAGHSAATCSATYLHLFEEFDPDAPRVTAEDRVRRAREAVRQGRALG
ncbi:MAG: tyrosine-type recombinase/integrase [Candidatus Limnocylindria bacterium]